jgi:hypothetical protein
MVRRKQEKIEEFDFETRDLARGLALMRIAFGCVMFLAPRRAARGWTGETPDDGVSVLSLRGMAARDLALGTGLLIALERGVPARGWIEAGALSDAGDAVATLFDGSSMSRPRRLFWLLAEAGTALFGGWLASEVDD